MRDFLTSISDVTLSPSNFRHPGMITVNERKALYYLAQNHYKGNGIILDAGVFLGASTLCLAAGLRDNHRFTERLIAQKPIHSYEMGIWNSKDFDRYVQSEEVLALIGGRIPEDGEDFTPILEELIRQKTGLVTFHWGDFTQSTTPEESVSIEIAFYDLLKTYERDWFAFQTFGPRYLPGQTVVVQQDYFYEGAIWARIRQEFLGDHFEFLGAVETTAFWRLTKEIPDDFFLYDPLLTLDNPTLVSFLEVASERTSDGRHQVASQLGIVDFLLERNQFTLAERKLSNIYSRFQPAVIPSRLKRALQIREKLIFEH